MTKHFCDACGKEISQGDTIQPLRLLCHIAESRTDAFKRPGHVKMVDGELLPISGREVFLELCLKCYNIAASAAMDKIDQIRKDH